MSMKKGPRYVVRSSELETGLSSSDKLIGMEVDTTASKPSSSKPSTLKPPASKSSRSFHAFDQPCGLD